MARAHHSVASLSLAAAIAILATAAAFAAQQTQGEPEYLEDYSSAPVMLQNVRATKKRR